MPQPAIQIMIRRGLNSASAVHCLLANKALAVESTRASNSAASTSGFLFCCCTCRAICQYPQHAAMVSRFALVPATRRCSPTSRSLYLCLSQPWYVVPTPWFHPDSYVCRPGHVVGVHSFCADVLALSSTVVCFCCLAPLCVAGCVVSMATLGSATS